ncbi:MAG: type II secretion system F family protein, partial [Acidimicrobiia bacterium]
AERVGDVMDGLSRDALLLRLRQARLFQDSDDPAAAYRIRQLLTVVSATAGSGAVAGMVGMSGSQVLAVVALGLVIGATRQRGRLDRAIDERRARMSIEIYTVNQLLAMRVRAGGGVVSAVSQIVARGRGEVVEELREALRLHRAGQPAASAFRRIADETPEPSCARTYGFLALAEERGTDLADALLSLAEDVRESRREAIRRSATKRRAAMLVPTIAILAPVMLLFVGAPLPSLVLGFD